MIRPACGLTRTEVGSWMVFRLVGTGPQYIGENIGKRPTEFGPVRTNHVILFRSESFGAVGSCDWANRYGKEHFEVRSADRAGLFRCDCP